VTKLYKAVRIKLHPFSFKALEDVLSLSCLLNGNAPPAFNPCIVDLLPGQPHSTLVTAIFSS